MASGKTLERTSIRAAPGGDAIGNIPAGAELTFSVELGGWLKLSSVYNVARSGYVNARSVRIDTVIVEPPPVEPPAGKRVTNIINVFSDGSINVIPQ